MNRGQIFILLCGGLCCLAATPAAVAEMSADSAISQMKRLFLEPGQRRQLEIWRKRKEEVVVVKEEPEPEAVPDYVTLKGIVIRSNGMHTVWLNEKKIESVKQDDERQGIPGMHIDFTRLDGEKLEVPLEVVNGNRIVHLKPGYSYNVQDETTVDGFKKK